jgi:hypothetical protein
VEEKAKISNLFVSSFVVLVLIALLDEIMADSDLATG